MSLLRDFTAIDHLMVVKSHHWLSKVLTASQSYWWLLASFVYSVTTFAKFSEVPILNNRLQMTTLISSYFHQHLWCNNRFLINRSLGSRFFLEFPHIMAVLSCYFNMDWCFVQWFTYMYAQTQNDSADEYNDNLTYCIQ